MNRVEKIWQELSAQPQEINLSKIDELNRLRQAMVKGEPKNFVLDARSSLIKLEQLYKENLSDSANLESVFNEIVRESRELGFDPSQMKWYDETEMMIKQRSEISSAIKAVQKALSLVESIPY